MAKASDILGMNARNHSYGSLNRSKAIGIANSKLKTKALLGKNDISVPQLYTKISSREALQEYDFTSIPTSFVIKPSGGSGGNGILIVRRPKNFRDYWLDVEGNQITLQDIKLHVEDILEGQYGTFGTFHMAFVEEKVPLHPKLKKYVYQGTPDLRILVFNSVPVMAMLRLPTKESDGKANLHQGGIGVGIDIASGVTLSGVHKNRKVRFLPGTKIKLNGIKIPRWKSVLETAVSAAVITNLQYVGVDILLHPDKGPMVIELNARPGLAIQLANSKGLRFRLERVEGIEITSVKHGVRVGQALFAERFADKVKADDGLVVINVVEPGLIQDADKKRKEIEMLADTSTYRSRIDRVLAQKLGLIHEESLLWKNSRQQVIEVKIQVKDRWIKSAISVVNLEKNKYKVILGRLDLQGFLVNPQKD